MFPTVATRMDENALSKWIAKEFAKK